MLLVTPVSPDVPVAPVVRKALTTSVREHMLTLLGTDGRFSSSNAMHSRQQTCGAGGTHVACVSGLASSTYIKDLLPPIVLCMQAHFAGASLYEGSEWCSSSDVMHSTIVVQSADARDVSEEEG